MAQPSFLTNGTTPLPTDTKHTLLRRTLGAYQNRAGANSANDPKITDTKRQLRVKILKSIKGIT